MASTCLKKSHREDRIKAIAAAKTKLAERAKERFGQEQADYQAKLDKRAAKSKESGKPPRGKVPVPPVEGAQDKDQINLTDEESRIMKVSGGGFDQCYNGQIAVDMDSMLIVTTGTVQACNDKQQIEPMLEQLKALPAEPGQLVNLVADTGYFSEANVKACGAHSITPLIAVSREAHHLDPLARFTEPPPLKEGGKDAAFTPDDGGAGTLCETQMHGGAGNRHHQGDIGIPPILTTRIGKRQRRVESGGDGVEFEANVCAGGVI